MSGTESDFNWLCFKKEKIPYHTICANQEKHLTVYPANHFKLYLPAE